jgi:hypothetical protein
MVREAEAAADVRGLHQKYTRMRTLRVLHERKKNDPSFEEPDPRDEMASLAEEFPGALREIDVLPLEVIEERIKELELCESDPTRSRATWMEAQTLFHRVARGALKTKRWLGKRKEITDDVRERFARELGAVDERARLFADDLESIANPPRGRVMEVVHAKVAILAGITATESKRLVFGEPRPHHNKKRRA